MAPTVKDIRDEYDRMTNHRLLTLSMQARAFCKRDVLAERNEDQGGYLHRRRQLILIVSAFNAHKEEDEKRGLKDAQGSTVVNPVVTCSTIQSNKCGTAGHTKAANTLEESMQTISLCRNCGGGDRGRVAIYRPFGEVSLSLNRHCHLYGAQGQRQAYFLPMPTMNFVGLALTTSDRWH
ncbi:hypothetical protein TNCV_2093661 [Trichonephila clavipes]|nr:hypothetical protein TNCV_2093661 [Trichonephila clavipes]